MPGEQTQAGEQEDYNIGEWLLHAKANVPAQARQANDLRLSTETRSRRCLEPDGWTADMP